MAGLSHLETFLNHRGAEYAELHGESLRSSVYSAPLW